MVAVNRPAQRILLVVLALVLLIPVGVMGLGGVLGGGDEAAEDTPSVIAEERPTVDPAEQPIRPELPRPEEPAGMTEQSAAGAEATLTYVLESYAYMMSSGDISVWENSVDPNCSVCTTFLANAETLAAQGGYLVDGEFTVHGTTFTGTGEPPATGEVTADFSQEASILVDDPTLQANELEAVSGQLIAQVAWDGERWRITDMSIAPDAAE